MPWVNYRDSHFNLIWNYASSLYINLANSSRFLQLAPFQPHAPFVPVHARMISKC